MAKRKYKPTRNPPDSNHSIDNNKLPKPKPFLKWAGGKRALLPEIKKRMPESYNKYYEPFVGAGALFFSEIPKPAILSDKNKELINCYKQVKKNPHEVIEALKPMKYNETLYYEIRGQQPKDPVNKAARFIYLNRCCWNGLWRVNSKGKFNVPIGRYKKPHRIYDEDVLISASNALENTRLLTGDFVAKSRDAQFGDFVYFDPPYTVKHGNNGFLSYNEKNFSWKGQEKLAKHAKELADRGVKVMISNADALEIKALYDEFEIDPVSRTSTISGDKEKRGKVSELIITSYDINKTGD